MSDTRRLIESSLRGSIRRTLLPFGEVPASLAGLCLALADGNPERAIALTTKIDTSDSTAAASLVAEARTYLAKVDAEERAERGPNLKTG